MLPGVCICAKKTPVTPPHQNNLVQCQCRAPPRPVYPLYASNLRQSDSCKRKNLELASARFFWPCKPGQCSLLRRAFWSSSQTPRWCVGIPIHYSRDARRSTCLISSAITRLLSRGPARNLGEKKSLKKENDSSEQSARCNYAVVVRFPGVGRAPLRCMRLTWSLCR